MSHEDEVLEELYLGSDTIELIEKSIESDGTVPIKIIQPGWGASGYYPAEVLAKDGPKAFKAGTHMYMDHPTAAQEGSARSVRDLAGIIVSEPKFDEKGKSGPGLYARAKVLPQYQEAISALAPYIGVSIRAHGTFRPGEVDGRKGKIIERIDAGESVDFVTQPGAGGKVLAMWESLSGPIPSATTGYVQPVTTTADPSYTITTTSNSAGTIFYPAQTAASEAAPTTPPSEVTGMSEELKEAQTRVSTLEGELTESKTALVEAIARAERAETALAIVEAQRMVASELANVSLPDACKERIVAKVSANPPLVEGKIDEAALKTLVADEAKAEAEYIERVTGGTKITEQGSKPDSAVDEKVVQENLSKRMGSFFRMDESTAKLAAQGR
jgi:hypothetical protein